MPARVFFVPDRLTKRERGRQGVRFLKAEPIADDGAAVVIFDHGEPGLGRLSCFIEQQHVKGRMIRLPHRIGMGRLSPIEQVKLLAVSGSSFVSHRHECGIEVLDDLTDTSIAGGFPALFTGDGFHLAVDGGGRAGRGLQSQSLD
jgi:hypothetical protein